jgi:hypothetical protein
MIAPQKEFFVLFVAIIFLFLTPYSPIVSTNSPLFHQNHPFPPPDEPSKQLQKEQQLQLYKTKAHEMAN